MSRPLPLYKQVIPTLSLSFPLSQILPADAQGTWESVLEPGTELNPELPLHKFFGI